MRGELGGPNLAKVVTATFLLTLWCAFTTLSFMELYCYLDEVSLLF